MAKNIVIKTRYVGEEGTISESFCVVKRKLYKQIWGELAAYFEDNDVITLSVLDEYGDEVDTIELYDLDDVLGDDNSEVISVSKITAEEMIEVFGHEYGQTSLLEVWAAAKENEDLQDGIEYQEAPEPSNE